MVEQLLVAVLPIWLGVHMPDIEKVPDPEVVQVTLFVPDGNDAVPPDVSASVAVQVVLLFAVTGEGVQATLTLVLRLLTVRLNVPDPELCCELPP